MIYARKFDHHRQHHHGRRESQPLYVDSELGRGVEEEMSLAAGKKLGPYEAQSPFDGGGITNRNGNPAEVRTDSEIRQHFGK